jgi:hypothetical protein
MKYLETYEGLFDIFKKKKYGDLPNDGRDKYTLLLAKAFNDFFNRTGLDEIKLVPAYSKNYIKDAPKRGMYRIEYKGIEVIEIEIAKTWKEGIPIIMISFHTNDIPEYNDYLENLLNTNSFTQSEIKRKNEIIYTLNKIEQVYSIIDGLNISKEDFELLTMANKYNL